MFQNLQQPFQDKDSALKAINTLFLNVLFLGIFCLLIAIIAYIFKDESFLIKLSLDLEVQTYLLIGFTSLVYLLTAFLFCKQRIKAVGYIFIIIELFNILTLSPIAIFISIYFITLSLKTIKAIDYLKAYESKK